MFFESKSKSGSGDIVAFELSKNKKSVTIENRNCKDAEDVLRKPNKDAGINYKGTLLNVTNYIVPITDPVRVLVSGMSDKTDDVVAALFMEVKWRIRPKKILRGKTPGTAVIEFNKQPDFSDLKTMCERHACDQAFWTVSLVELSSKVLVKKCNSKTTAETLELYFENRNRSGGGYVLYVEPHHDLSHAYIVCFKHVSDAERVVNDGRTHTLDNNTLTVSLYYPCLDRDPSEETAIPEPVLIEDLDQYRARFLFESDQQKAKVEASLKDAFGRPVWIVDKNGCTLLQIECTVDPKDSSSRPFINHWKERIHERILWIFNELKVDETNVMAIELFDKMKITLQKVTVLRPEALAIFLDRKSSRIVIVGEVKEVDPLSRDIAKLIKELENELYNKLPKDVQQLDDKAITLFYKALEHGKEKVNNVRLMVVGLFGVGKTSLVNNLILEFRQKKQNKITLSTEGVAIHRCKLMTDGDWCLDTELKGVKFGSRINDLLAERVTFTEDHETQTQTEPLQTFKEKIALHKGDELLQHGITVAKKMLESTSDNSEKSRASLDESKTEITTSDNSEKSKAALDESKNEITVSVWDFAGQTLYYSTHQFFLNERSIYLVVMDMTRSLKDVVSKSDGIGIWCGLVDSCTYLDIFKFWLNAIHMNSDYQSGERTIKPIVILVGTRKDKMKGSAEEKYQNMKLYFDNALCSFDKHSPIFNHIHKKRFLVNNLSPKDSAFAELRKEIISLASNQDYWDEEYPVRWIHMERKLDKMRDEKLQIVKMKDVEKENLENIQPLGKEALTSFLELQHKQGNIIFFNSGELKDFVVLAPQWIIEAFKCFIPHNQEIEATVLKDWEEYKTYAILKKNVLDEVMKNSPPYIHDYQTAVINYMEYLNVIAKPLTSEEGITGIPLDFHIVPCLLSRAPPPLHDFTSPPDKPQTPVLAFVFCGKFLPPSFFHRLVAVCIRAWPICQERGRYCLFNGLAIFTLNDTYTLRIWYMDYIIYARIVCCSENEKLDNFIWLFQEVRQQLKKSLKDFVHQSSPVFEEYIQCPDMKVSLHNKGLFLVKQFKYKNAIACPECNPHAVTRSNAMKHWFKERLDRIEKDDE